MDDSIPRKRCIECKEEKLFSEFYPIIKSAPQKFRARCKNCMSSGTNSRYATMTPAQKQHNLHLKKQRARNNPRYQQRANVRLYEITLEQYNALFQSQNGLCAICGKPETVVVKGTGTVQRLAIDHCHTTGKVRELLCSKCNRVIGYMEKLLSSSSPYMAYIQSHSPK